MRVRFVVFEIDAERECCGVIGEVLRQAQIAGERLVIALVRAADTDTGARIGTEHPRIAEIDGIAPVAEALIERKLMGRDGVLADLCSRAGDSDDVGVAGGAGDGFLLAGRRDRHREGLGILPGRCAVRRGPGEAVIGRLDRQAVAGIARDLQPRDRLDRAHPAALLLIEQDRAVEDRRAQVARGVVDHAAAGVAADIERGDGQGRCGRGRLCGLGIGMGRDEQIRGDDAQRPADAALAELLQLHPQPPPSKVRPPLDPSLLK